VCKVNGGSSTIALSLEVNTALVEYYASHLLGDNGIRPETFSTEEIVEAAEVALQQRFGDMAEDSDHFLHRFASDERFMLALGV